MSTKVKKERDLSFDIMNILACISVVCLHHNGLVHTYYDTPGWRQSLVVECVFYWAVPVFFMITGATLMNYREKYSTKEFFKKRFVRTVIPWLFWSAVTLIVNSKLGLLAFDPPTFRNALSMIFNNRVESIYWYFPQLFACYLAIPVLSLIRDERKTLWYIVLLNFFFLSVRPVLKNWFGFSWSLDVPFVGSHIIFVILGWLLNTKMPDKKTRMWIYITGIACLIFRFGYMLHFSVLTGVTDTTIKGYTIFHSVFYSVAVFIFLKQVNWNRIIPEKVRKLIPAISACSFGIYLIHKRVMYVEMMLLGINDFYWTWRILCIPLTYLVSLAIVWLIRKIPYLKITVGG